MVTYFAYHDAASGEILGFFCHDIHGDDIPTPNVPLTEEQWRDCLAHPGRRRISPEGDVVSYEPPIDLEDLRNKKMDEISGDWKREISEVGMPTGLGFNVDFDILDQQIWKEGVEALPADLGEIEVWDIGNRPHIVTREQYVRIQETQKPYYTQMLQKKWALRRDILEATTIEELEMISW